MTSGATALAQPRPVRRNGAGREGGEREQRERAGREGRKKEGREGDACSLGIGRNGTQGRHTHSSTYAQKHSKRVIQRKEMPPRARKRLLRMISIRQRGTFAARNETEDCIMVGDLGRSEERELYLGRITRTRVLRRTQNIDQVTAYESFSPLFPSSTSSLASLPVPPLPSLCYLFPLFPFSLHFSHSSLVPLLPPSQQWMGVQHRALGEGVIGRQGTFR